MQLKKHQIITLSVFLVITLSLFGVILAGVVVNVAANSPDSNINVRIRGMHITPTPFQPNSFAYVLEDGSIEVLPPQPENTPTPVPTIELAELPERQLNILLLGSDSRNDGSYRTDVILLLSLNPEHQAVSVVSFPRDLYVTIPGWQMNRINTAHMVGGFELLAETFQANFGIRPDLYLMVDFAGFRAVIESLGGIDVQVEKFFEDQCDHTLSINSHCFVYPGVEHMDADWALWYARARYSTNDFDRARRAQEVVQAIFYRIISLDMITKVPEMYDLYTQYVETNVGLGDILAYLPLAYSVRDGSNINRYVVGQEHVTNWITGEGAMVLIPDYYAIQNILAEALYLNQ